MKFLIDRFIVIVYRVDDHRDSWVASFCKIMAKNIDHFDASSVIYSTFWTLVDEVARILRWFTMLWSSTLSIMVDIKRNYRSSSTSTIPGYKSWWFHNSRCYRWHMSHFWADCGNRTRVPRVTGDNTARLTTQACMRRTIQITLHIRWLVFPLLPHTQGRSCLGRHHLYLHCCADPIIITYEKNVLVAYHR